MKPLKQLNADSQDLDATYASEERGRAMVERAKNLGLYDWIVSRSPCLWGTPGEVAVRLNELKGRGIYNWMLWPDNADLDDLTVTRLLSQALTLSANA